MKDSRTGYRTSLFALSPALLRFAFGLLLASGAASVQAQSALDGFDPNLNGAIAVIVTQPDGKILIGGPFTTVAANGGASVTRNGIARLNADGTLDTAFDPNALFGAAGGAVLCIALQADGKILVGGFFSAIGGQLRNYVARLDPVTGLADSFNPAADNQVFAIAVQADGKILAGGPFNTIGGQLRNQIARLDPATGQADAFAPNANGIVYSIAIQRDGKIVVGGAFNGIGGQTRGRMARLDRATGLADSFAPNSNNTVFSIAIQPDGKVVAGGFFTFIGGQPRNRIARLDPVTGLADSLDPNANAAVRAVALQADGKILAGGEFTGPNSIGGQNRGCIARLDPATGLADSFDPNANNTPNSVEALAVQADGKILAGGYFTTLTPNAGATVTRNRIARLEKDGSLDRTLNLNTVGLFVAATAIQPDGKILIGGRFTNVLGMTRKNIARLHPDGSLDIAFDPNANGDVYAIALQPDGKILVGGGFFGASSIGGQDRNRIARLDPTTGLADSFNPNAVFIVNAIAVQLDGKVLVGGLFTGVIGGQLRNYLVRLDPATGLADSFNPSPNNYVNSIAVQADGKILVGGTFNGANSIGGQARNRIARLDATSGLADSFDPNANDEVFTIVAQTDGKILAAGAFNGANSIGGQTRNRIARLDAITGAADSFNPDAASGVRTIAVQADGKIIAGGFFQAIGGQTRHRIARLDATTGAADSFDPNADDAVYAIALQADGKILAGGFAFTNIGGQPRGIFARLSNDTGALQNLAVTQPTLTWTRGGSSPKLARVTFESSTDNVNYTLLGNGSVAGSNWTLTGLSLPTDQNIYIRARGYYHSGTNNASHSITESVRNAFVSPQAAQPLNLSTRLRVLTGDNVGIGGFIITGTAPKHVLLRAIGPALTAFGVPNALADPVLELHGPGAFVTIVNNDWRDSQEAAIQASGIPPTNNLESAIDATLAPGAYTAIVRGNGNTAGGALIEAYDLNQAAASKLANISTRAFVSTGDDIVIAGVILGNGGAPGRIIVRGIGPSLMGFGVPNALANPTLELRDSSGALVVSNNDWQDNPAAATDITAAGLAPSDHLESALVATLPPGRYTALLAGQSNGTGNGLIEIYDVN